MSATAASQLHTKLMSVAPVVSVSIPDPNNRPGWIVQYDVTATPAQITAAQTVIAAFDPLAEAARMAALVADPNLVALKTQLQSATPAQIISYVDAQVPELSAAARTLLKKILTLLATTLA